MSTSKSEKHNQNYIYISRLLLLYTFVGVTYLLFIKSSPKCSCASFNNQYTKQQLSTDTLLVDTLLADALLKTEANITIDSPIDRTPSHGSKTKQQLLTDTLLKTEANITIDIPSKRTPSHGSKRNLLATTAWSVKKNYESIENLYSMLPNGIVLLWYGSIASIPVSWHLCDGTNGTPDLRDRFVVGGGATYDLDDFGGTPDITLTINDIPSHAHNIIASNVGTSTQSAHQHTRGTFSLSNRAAHTHPFSTTSGLAGQHSHSVSGTTGNEPTHRHSFSDSSSTTSSHSGHNHDLNRNTVTIYGWGTASRDISVMRNGGGSGYKTSSDGSHTHTVSVSGNTGYSGSHSHSTSGTTATKAHHAHSIGGTTDSSNSHTHTLSGSSASNGGHSHTVTGTTEYVGNGNTINILNPYYTAYYIMKVPYTFPTDDPTESPTLAPSIAPSIAPSLAPSVSPSIAPSLAPSLNPSLHPSIAPSLNPSIAPSYNPSITPSYNPSLHPSIAPSYNPSITPSLNPSIAPSLAPSIAPSLAPSIAPSLAPSLSPAHFPSFSPTFAPSIAPSNAPSLVPSIAPSLAPTQPPTIAPSIAPSLAPSDAPSIAPTTPPTNAPSIVPSIAPSIAPSLAPSIAPSLAPTDAPTFSPSSAPTPMCWDAKYKLYMIKTANNLRNDVLLSSESLVSVNCRFILTMKDDGNLVLNGLVGKYIDPFGKDETGNFINDENKMRMYVGWQSNSTIKDNSDESIALAQLKDGTLMVEEHEFYGVPEFDPIELWKSGEYINTENELILQLSDNGCLTVNKYYGVIDFNLDNFDPIWVVCAELEKDRPKNDDIINIATTTIETTVMLTTEISKNENEFGISIDNQNDKIKLLTIWNVIISCVVIVILLMCFYICVNRLYNNYKIANPNMYQSGMSKSNEFGENNDINDGDMNDEMDKEIELWGMETNNTTNANTEEIMSN